MFVNKKELSVANFTNNVGLNQNVETNKLWFNNQRFENTITENMPYFIE